MGVRFKCPQCSAEISSVFLDKGKPYKCTSCGHTGEVPVTASNHEIAPPEELKRDPVDPSSVQTEEQPAIRVIRIIAAAVNGCYLILSIIGFANGAGKTMDRSTLLLAMAPIFTALANIAILVRVKPKSINSFVATNVIIFILFGLFALIAGKEPGSRFGGVISIGTGLVTVVALVASEPRSWLSLYFQRKRLEELNKIAVLEDKLRQKDQSSSQ